jgi:hypothetical protein
MFDPSASNKIEIEKEKVIIEFDVFYSTHSIGMKNMNNE